MKVAFTICSNNYLAQAKTLGDSLKNTNPDYTFVIGLVDVFSDKIDYSFFQPYEIVPIDKIGIPDFEEMVDKYDITELNTAVKPYLFNFLFKRNEKVDTVLYFDPDIYIYKSLDFLESCLAENNIVVTPHFMTPIYDNFRLGEPDILNAGLYNLGFLGVTRSAESQKFLEWWMIKLKDQCLIDLAKGLFVDQLWINFVPLYFEKVFILRHLGYNIAYWNLHERTLAEKEGAYFVNAEYPLVFFHFSGFNFKQPQKITKHQNRYTFQQRPDLVPVFEHYHQIVVSNNFKEFSTVPCYYIKPKNVSKGPEQGYSYRDYLYLIRQKMKKDLLSKRK